MRRKKSCRLHTAPAQATNKKTKLNKMKKTFLTLMGIALIATTALIYSCNKEEVSNTELQHISNNTKSTPQNEDGQSRVTDSAKPSKISLAELKKLCQEDDDIAFFKENRMVDNTAIYTDAQAGLLRPTPIDECIHFEWHWPSLNPKPQDPPMPKGTKSIACGDYPGICFYISFLKGQLPEGYSVNSDVQLYKNHMIIMPKDDDNGITSDGYLTVKYDINIKELGKTIKSGIYKANYDKDAGRYTAIVVDFE